MFFGEILWVEWVRLPAVLTRPGRPFDHAPDRLGAVGLAIDVEVAKRSELGGDLAQAAPLSRFGAGPVQPLGLCHDLRPRLEVRLAALDLAVGALAVPRGFQLLHQPCLFQLRKHAHDLPHGDPEFIVTVGQVVAGGGQDAHAQANQQRNAGLLGQQMSGKPTGILDDDDAHAVADHPLEECLEASPALSLPDTAAS